LKESPHFSQIAEAIYYPEETSLQSLLKANQKLGDVLATYPNNNPIDALEEIKTIIDKAILTRRSERSFS